LAELEREAEAEAASNGGQGADYESSEPTSMTNSSTVEGELTIQGQMEEEEEGEEDEEEDIVRARVFFHLILDTKST